MDSQGPKDPNTHLQKILWREWMVIGMILSLIFAYALIAHIKKQKIIVKTTAYCQKKMQAP